MRHEAAVESEWMSDLMALVEFMAQSADGDGMPKQPGILVISTQGVAWVVEVIDRNTGLGFAVMRFTLDDAIDQAEAMLRSGNAPWTKLRNRVRPSL